MLCKGHKKQGEIIVTTQQANPYASPKSEIDTLDSDGYADIKAFSFSGRIGRLRYLAYSMALMFLSSFAGGFVGAILAPFMQDAGDAGAAIAVIFMVIVYGFMLVASFALAVRRLNDFNTSGWMSLLFFVPFVNIIFTLALWFVPGTKGSNRYGLQPPTNGAGVIILALLLPLFVGIIAATAIPAYNDYVQRAAEMQAE
jgi:uncharacterized membrane protein YhaH (DUF805 family)